MGQRTVHIMKDFAKAICIKDTKTERYGFLFLKSRQVKDERITKGKEYKFLELEVLEFGNIYSGSVESRNITIIDDNGCKQIFDDELFQHSLK